MNINTKKQLIDGNYIPIFGFGTWKLKGDECRDIVDEALNQGITHIDTALDYKNQKEIGEVLQKHNRSKLFITSKVWRDDLSYEGVKKQVNIILTQLNTQYLDLCLIHWPNSSYPLEKTLKAFKELKDDGVIKSIGVSNFTIHHLKEAMKYCDIAVNQIECHPYFQDKTLLDFCAKNSIEVEAYCPLAHGDIKGDETLKKIGLKYGKDEFQITLRWLIQKNIIVIPKTTSSKNLTNNIDIFDFELEKDEINQINSLNTNKRLIDFDFSEFSY